MDEGKGDYVSIQHSKADNVGKIPNLSVPGQKGLDNTWKKASKLTADVIAIQTANLAESDRKSSTSVTQPPSNGDSEKIANQLLQIFANPDYNTLDEATIKPLSEAEKKQRIAEVATRVATDPKYQDDEKAIAYMVEAMHTLQDMPREQIKSYIEEGNQHGSVRDFLFQHIDSNFTNNTNSDLNNTELALKTLAEKSK